MQAKDIERRRQDLASDFDARIGDEVRQMPTGAILDSPVGRHGIEPRSGNAARQGMLIRRHSLLHPQHAE